MTASGGGIYMISSTYNFSSANGVLCASTNELICKGDDGWTVLRLSERPASQGISKDHPQDSERTVRPHPRLPRVCRDGRGRSRTTAAVASVARLPHAKLRVRGGW